MPLALRLVRPLAAPLLTGVLLGLVVLPPFVGLPAQALLYAAFSFVCHQLPARSFHLHETAFAVCHRCTGIYAGLLAGALLWPLVRRHDAWLQRHAPRMLVLSLVPGGADWLLGVTGVWANTPLSQALTGSVFGAVAGVYLARGLAGPARSAAQARQGSLLQPADGPP